MLDPRDGGSATETPEESLVLADVSDVLGVPARTLRSWEWRYHLATGRRRVDGQRRFTQDDVETLAAVRDQTAAGAAGAQAVDSFPAHPPTAPPQVVDRLVAATHRLHTESIVEALEQSRLTYGLPVTLEQVVLPALREIGQQWASGSSDVVHEHLLAGAVQRWLSARQHDAGPPTRPGAVVLACSPDDQHTLALQALGALLAHQGFPCRYLGAKTPIASLVLAAERPPASAVVVVAHLKRTRAGAISALEAVAELPVALFYAGGAFNDPASRRDVPGTYLGDNLTLAADLIAAAID